MVEDYTERSLSNRGDILVAIGALAREFHTKHAAMLGRYLAGLWENHLRSCLLWYDTNNPSIPLTGDRSQYLAPSWSWASCCGPVLFRNEPEWYLPLNGSDPGTFYIPRWYCEVLSCEVTPHSELDPFGAVESGSLTIRGPLRPLARQPYDSDDTTEAQQKSPGCPDLYLEESLDAAVALILDRPLVAHEATGNEDSQYHWLGIWYAGRSRARGLIVQQIDETSFRRLGLAEYVVEKEEFPSSELHNERVIHLV